MYTHSVDIFYPFLVVVSIEKAVCSTGIQADVPVNLGHLFHVTFPTDSQWFFKKQCFIHHI